MRVLGVIVLAGGGATRMGGVPKPALTVAGVRLIDRVLAAATPLGPVVVVAPPDLPLPPNVHRTREDPPGSGPVAAFAAGLDALTGRVHPLPAVPDAPMNSAVTGPDAPTHPTRADASAVPTTDCVVLLGGDLPVIVTADLIGLMARLGDQDAAAFVDHDGRAQWMCSVWRLDVLLERLRSVLARAGGGKGPSIRELTRDLRVELVSGAGGPHATTLPPWFDCDTEDDLRRAEEWLCR